MVKDKCIRWKDTKTDVVPAIKFTGMPFIIMGKQKFPCLQGKDKDVASKRNRKEKIEAAQNVCA